MWATGGEGWTDGKGIRPVSELTEYVRKSVHALGERRRKPISGTLGRNWRPSEINEPSGEISVLLCGSRRFTDFEERPTGTCGSSNPSYKDQKMILSGYQIEHHSNETSRDDLAASKEIRT